MTFSTDQFRLDGKVAIVTGAGGRGNSIGRAYALGLAGAGAAVVVADINEAGAKAVAAEIAGSGGKAIGVRVDITDPDLGAGDGRHRVGRIWRRGYPGEQRGAHGRTRPPAHRRRADRGLEPHAEREPHRCADLLPGGDPGHARARRRAHREPDLRRRIPRHRHLRHRQARAGGADHHARQGPGQGRDHRQRDRARQREIGCGQATRARRFTPSCSSST